MQPDFGGKTQPRSMLATHRLASLSWPLGAPTLTPHINQVLMARKHEIQIGGREEGEEGGEGGLKAIHGGLLFLLAPYLFDVAKHLASL